ncbi:hypothetical protein [Streptomyces sp. TRM72054]|uniref:hypothetical protein n=1 Tax=Streptomyces sp. TRM72054 TaxID=2870562 RepID=UPI0021AB5E44|nr:hypothetical protein [Streptomyces sp. TRM72054]
MTMQGSRLWERSVLRWRYPRPELRMLVDGPRLRLHHEVREAGTMLPAQAGAVYEIRVLARRHGVR